MRGESSQAGRDCCREVEKNKDDIGSSNAELTGDLNRAAWYRGWHELVTGVAQERVGGGNQGETRILKGFTIKEDRKQAGS